MQAQDTPQRKYALSKVKSGNYLLPSNDGRTIWRIASYTEGPSSGIDWPRDRTVWAFYRWEGEVGPGAYVDAGSWDRWEMVGSMCATRADAINEALGIG